MRSYSKEELERCYKEYIEPEFIPDERYPLKEFCEYFDEPGHHIEFDDRSCVAWCDLSDGIKWIIFFVVGKDHRNSGEGTKILQEWMERNGTPKTVVDAASEDAFRFWKKNGFCRVEGYEYVQPALFPGMNPVSSLVLATNFDAAPDKIDFVMKEYFDRELSSDVTPLR